MDFTSYHPVATMKVDVGFASTASAVIAGNSGRVTVRLFASVPTCIAIGDNPTATADGLELAPNLPEYIDVMVGQKIAAIRAASETGTLKITTMTKRSA